MDIKSVPQWVAGSPILAKYLEAMRQKGAQDTHMTQGINDQVTQAFVSKNTTKPRFVRVKTTGTGIQKYSVFGIKKSSSFQFLNNYLVEVDLSDAEDAWLLTNSNHGLSTNTIGWAIPIGADPVKLRYTGSAPSINDFLGITNGAVDKDASPKRLIAVSNPSGDFVWCTALGGGGGEPVSVFDFNTNAIFEKTDNTVQVTHSSQWIGLQPDEQETPEALNNVTVHNSGNMFSGPITGLYGIAYWNDTDKRYQILQLDCVDLTATALMYFDESQGGFSYDDTPTTVRLDSGIQDGDLLTFDFVNNEFELLRDPYGALKLGVDMTIESISGVELDDATRLTFQVNDLSAGTGWQTSSIFGEIAHTSFKSGPTRATLGGTLSLNFFIGLGLPAGIGDKFRFQLQTYDGSLITSLKVFNVGIEESEYTPSSN